LAKNQLNLQSSDLMIIKCLVNVLEPSMEHEQTYNKEEDDSEEITVKQKEVYLYLSFMSSIRKWDWIIWCKPGISAQKI